MIRDQFRLKNRTTIVVITITARRANIGARVLDFSSFLNLSENIGVLLTNKNEIIRDRVGMNLNPLAQFVKKLSGVFIMKYTNEPQSIAAAGVARPINEYFWAESRLNLASLIAENTTIIKGMNVINPTSTPNSIISRCSIVAGNKPKLIRSAKESSSFPISEYAPISRAVNPSKKSSIAAAIIKYKARSSL